MIFFENDYLVFLVVGFGGVIVDIVKVFGVDDGNWLLFFGGGLLLDLCWESGCMCFFVYIVKLFWVGLNNGFSNEENWCFVVMYCLSDIVMFVSFGLG